MMLKMDHAPDRRFQIHVAPVAGLPASTEVQSEAKISMPKFDMPKISSPTGGYDLDIPVAKVPG
jgi:hypothetical protein